MISTKNISNRHSLEKGLSNLIPVSKFTNLIFLCAKNEMGDKILINKINAKINIYKKFNLNCSINFGYNFGSKLNTTSCDNPVLSDNLSQSLELNLHCKVVERSSNKICRPITKIGKHIFYSLVETINGDFVDDNVLSVDAKFTYLINSLNRTYVEAFREKKGEWQ
nr:unnamed protein product [Callosobruchus analis]